jgi:5,10-methylenetetrahydrofolate reductase
MKYFEITDKRDKEMIYRLINGENLRFTQFFYNRKTFVKLKPIIISEIIFKLSLIIDKVMT